MFINSFVQIALASIVKKKKESEATVIYEERKQISLTGEGFGTMPYLYISSAWHHAWSIGQGSINIYFFLCSHTLKLFQTDTKGDI